MITLPGKHTDFFVLTVNSLLIAIFWTILCFLSAYWNITTEKEKTLELAQKEARTVFDKDQAFRFWATDHEGVYVPITRTTPPSEYLSLITERDLVTPSGKQLTLMNPAYMMRQVMSQYADVFSTKSKITSLKVLNPINKPDEWEMMALQKFNDGQEEVMEIALIEGSQFLRLMKPMFTKVSCLKCHAQQGYKEGDVRGGVSVSIPLEPYLDMEQKSLNTLYITHLFFWFSGFIVLVFTFYRGKKRIIERLEDAQTLQKHSEKVKLFAYSVAHDLKNPVIAIHGLAKVLRNKYQDVLDEKGRKFCEEIIKSSAQINVLIKQINIYISTKEHPLTLEEVDFLEICHTTRVEYSDQLRRRNILLVEPAQVAMLRADRVAILRILRNFIDNALKYGGDTLSKIEIVYNESGDFHTFHIFNDGKAIASGDYQNYFLEFRRNDTNNEVEGAGLGLSIIKELVGLHGGKVWGESDGRKGVHFCFTISKKL